MKELELIFNLMLALEEMGKEIPVNTSKEVEFEGNKISISNDEEKCSVQIEAEHEDDFDDTAIKEVVNEYKESVKDLDDDIFIEALEDMNEVIDVKELDRLLSLDKFTEEEAIRVEDMIDCSSAIIADKLHDRIDELMDLYDRF